MESLAIVLLTQRRHGESLLEAAAHFTGDSPPDFVAVSLLGNESRGEIESRLGAAVAEFRGRGVLILCDLFGSTHAAIACDFARRDKNIACVCGLNLAMLMEAQTARMRPLKQAATRVAEAARRSIVCGRRT
ncbi:MAG: PTS sugar transporter subunit IIA [Gammaproteobacteria bacterium]